MEIIRLDNTTSTIDFLLASGCKEELCVIADYQSAGKGMGQNTWESERGKNLLFSVLLHPVWLPVAEQYLMSMAWALALYDAVAELLGTQSAMLSIKWPNDIYYADMKLSGTRIDINLQGFAIQDMVIGTGINVNQTEFRSDAPNPVSLWQIIEQETDREQLLRNILKALAHYQGSDVKASYLSLLYRRKDFHPYVDKDGAFMAEIVDVEDDGHLLLRDEEGKERRYAFKEVSFII